MSILLIDRGDAYYMGPAYSDVAEHLLLNVPAGRMGALSDDPEHFLKWTQQRGVCADRWDFLPRRLYRDYLIDLLEKVRHERLRIEFTKSRPRHSNDNGLAETKNGAIVRKHLGYEHIPQRFAAQVNTFCQDFLNPYVNFHRPCFFAETLTNPKGRIRKRYLLKSMMTPYEKLKSLPKAKDFLKPGISFTQLDSIVTASSDNEAARRLNEARTKLFPLSIQTCRLNAHPSHPRSGSYLNWN